VRARRRRHRSSRRALSSRPCRLRKLSELSAPRGRERHSPRRRRWAAPARAGTLLRPPRTRALRATRTVTRVTSLAQNGARATRRRRHVRAIATRRSGRTAAPRAGGSCPACIAPKPSSSARARRTSDAWG
jgi:hypothetical protein